jgi:glutathione S-transferase
LGTWNDKPPSEERGSPRAPSDPRANRRAEWKNQERVAAAAHDGTQSRDAVRWTGDVEMLTLYHAPGSPSARALWLLEELDADYQVEYVSFPRADGSGADPKNPHPHGFAPALDHDGHIVSETGAIFLYLIDLHSNSPLGVPIGNPLRGQYVSWLFYQVGLSEPLIYMKGANVLGQDASMSRLYGAMMRRMERTLETGPFILEERFTALDILYVSLFEDACSLLPKSRIIDAYLERGRDREARQRARARDKPPIDPTRAGPSSAA